MTEQDSPSSTAIRIDPIRWPLIFTLLSMDVVLAFHDLVGLVFNEPIVFRDLLRTQILQVRREFAAAAPGSVTYSPERMLDAVARTLGENQRKYLVWWGQRIFTWDLQEHRGLLLWEDVLRFCASDAARWRQLGLPERLADSARQEFGQATDREPYDQRYEEVSSKPLSDWDLHMYAVNLFDDEDAAIPTGPGTYLYPTFKNYRGYRFWAWLLRQVTPQEQAILRQNAMGIARQVDSLAHVGELPAPSSLEVSP